MILKPSGFASATGTPLQLPHAVFGAAAHVFALARFRFLHSTTTPMKKNHASRKSPPDALDSTIAALPLIPRILIIGHSVMSGSGLTLLINRVSPHTQVRFTYPSHAIEDIKSSKPDVIILDTTTRSREFFTLIRTVRKRPVLLIVSSDSPADSLPFLRAGAMGLIDDQCTDAEMLQALNSYMQGQIHVPERYRRKLLLACLREDGAMVKGKKLSRTQVRLIEFVLQGLSINEIAQEMNLRVASVHVYLCRIRKELGLTSQRQLERYLHDNPNLMHIMES